MQNMDEIKVPLYIHTGKPLRDNRLLGRRLVAPTVKLMIEGNTKNATVDAYNIGWMRMLQLYSRANPGKEPQIDDIIEGFESEEKGIAHSFEKVKGKEQKRLVRLMFDRPTRFEELMYASRSIFIPDDTFCLDRYISSIIEPFEHFGEGEKRFLRGIGYTDAARIILDNLGELRED